MKQVLLFILIIITTGGLEIAADNVATKPSQQVKLVDDPKQGIIWRDYVLQKYPELLEWLQIPEDRKLIVNKLWKMSEEPTHTFAGTALLGLLRLSKVKPEEADPGKLAAQAMKIVNNEDFSLASRITAIQIAMRLKDGKVLDKARVIAVSKEQVMLRVSAIGAIGELGNYGDIEILNKYKLNADVRLRYAANAAISKIQKRKS